MLKYVSFIIALVALTGAGCLQMPTDSDSPAGGTYPAGQVPDDVGPADELPGDDLPPPGAEECPDVCVAICAGEPEPNVPANCPMPMCACDEQ